jgi:hypothetical protein
MSASPTIQNLDLVERRGYITYSNPNGDAVEVEGWFMLTVDGRGVVRRKVGGRNRSLFCSFESVIAFDLYDAEFEKFSRELKSIVARTRSI